MHKRHELSCFWTRRIGEEKGEKLADDPLLEYLGALSFNVVFLEVRIAVGPHHHRPAPGSKWIQ